MKGFNFSSILFLLVSFLSFQTATIAQTMDYPMPLTEGRLTINSSNQVVDYYYSFEAQVGEIVISGDGMGSSGVFFVGLLNTDFQNVKLSEQFISGTPTRRKVMRINIGKAQKVLLKIKAPKSSNASLALRIEGTAQFGGSNVPDPNMGNTTDNISINESSLRKVIFTLKNGQVLEGTFGDLQMVNIGDDKIGLTIRFGNNLPKVALKDIQSILLK